MAAGTDYGTQLSIEQIVQLEQAAGISDKKQLAVGAAIAEAESRGLQYNTSPMNSDGSIDRGLWQINSKAHPQYDPAQVYSLAGNASDMFQISKGGTDWNAWTTYTNNSYKTFLPNAQAAVNKVESGQPVNCETPGIGGAWCVLSGAAKGVGTVANGIGTAAGNVGSSFDFLNKFTGGNAAGISTGVILVFAFLILIVLIKK